MIGAHISVSRIDEVILCLLEGATSALNVSTLTAQAQETCPNVTAETIEVRLDMLRTRGLVVFTLEGDVQLGTRPLAQTGH